VSLAAIDIPRGATAAQLERVRNIALSLPGVEEGEGRFGFHVIVKDAPGGFAWSWLERVDPKKGRVENTAVLAVRTSSVAERDLLIASEPTVCFTEPHYNGYPAVLVRLDRAPTALLEVLLLEAWRRKAPRELRELVLA
jgi:hypothetical protein